MPDHPLMTLGRRMNRSPGVVLADALSQGSLPSRGPTSMSFFAGVAVLSLRSMRFRAAGTGAI